MKNLLLFLILLAPFHLFGQCPTNANAVIEVCNDAGGNSTITATFNDGTAPFTYILFDLAGPTAVSDPFGPVTVTNLAANQVEFGNVPDGDYLIRVNGTGPCNSNIGGFGITVSSAAALTAVINTVTPACTPGSGIVDINVAGGAAPYTFAWTQDEDGGFADTAEDITGIDPGTYNVTVTDDNNCTTEIIGIVVPIISTSEAGSNQTICVDNTLLAATPVDLAAETGAWSDPDGIGVVFTDPTDPATTVSGLPVGVNRLRWTVSDNGMICPGKTDDVFITRNALPTANDQTPVICEDTEGSGMATVDLTAFEAAINGGGGITYSYFEDAGLATPVATPANITASNGDDFFILVDDGTCTDVASVVITIAALPAANDQTPSVCEDTFGSGTATVDLTVYQGAVNGGGGMTYTWYEDAGLVTPVPAPANVVVSTGSDYFVEVNDGTCTNVASITMTVTVQPTANDQAIDLCEDTFGSGTATTNLTTLEGAVNGGGGITYSYFEDAGLVTPVGTPANVTAGNGEDYFVRVDDGVCTNVATITVNVSGLPVANDQATSVCANTTEDLTGYEAAVNGGANITYQWFEDAGLGTLVPDPTSVVIAADISYFVVVTNTLTTCTNTAQIDYTVDPLPTANDQNITACESVFGSGTATINLTSTETAVNGGGGITYSWFEDAALTTPVATPASIVAANGDDFFVQVDDGNCTNIATVIVAVTANPVANNQAVNICFDTDDDLTGYEAAINGGANITYQWFEDAGLATPVATPTAVNITANISYFVLITNTVTTCTNIGQIDYTVDPLPTANNQTPAVCEDIFGGGTATVDLTSFEAAINGGGGITYSYFEDAGLTIAVADATAAPANDGDDFFVQVDDGTCTDVATVTITIVNQPVGNDQTPTVCEDTFGGGTATVDLTGFEAAINGGGGITYSYFEDAALTTPVGTPASVVVNDADDYFVQVSDGTCASVASLTFAVASQPEANDLFEDVCEDTFGSNTATVDLTFYAFDIKGVGGGTLTYFEDAALTVSVPDPTTVVTANGDDFFVLVNDGTCTNVGSITFTVVGLPIANNQAVSICEGSMEDLTTYETAVNGGANTIYQWFEDPLLTTPVGTPNAVNITADITYYVQVTNTITTCSHVAQLDYTVNVAPVANDQAATVCTGAAHDLTAYEAAVNGGANIAYRWFADVNLTSFIVTPSAVTVNSDTTFYVEVKNTITDCISVGQVDITSQDMSPDPTAPSPISACQNDAAPTLTAVGTNLIWYDTDPGLGGATQLTTGANFTPTAGQLDMTTVATTSFFVTQDSGCGESNAIEVVVDVVSLSPAPMATTPIDACQNDAAPTLTAVGTNLIWYDTDPGLGGATQLTTGANFTPTAGQLDMTTAATTSFFVTQDIGCGESVAAEVVVNVTGASASPGVTSPVEVCQNTAAPTLTATGTNLIWYNTDPGLGGATQLTTGPNFTPTPAQLSMSTPGFTSFFVTQDASGCGESVAAQITVEVIIASDARCGTGDCNTVVVTPMPTPAACGNSNDGTIFFEIDPPTPTVNNTGVTINITGPVSRTNFNNPTFVNLPGGLYAYSIEYGDPNCIKTGNVTVPVTEAPVGVSFDLDRICNNDTQAISLTNITGDAGPLQIDIYKLGEALPRETVNLAFIPPTGEYLIENYTFFNEEGNYEVVLTQIQTSCNVTVTALAPFPVTAPIDATITGIMASYPDRATGDFMITNITGGIVPYFTTITLDLNTLPPTSELRDDFSVGPDEVFVNDLNGKFEQLYAKVPAGIYDIQIVGNGGCVFTFTADVPMDSSLFIPNIITPNGDDVNEKFYIRNLPEEDDNFIIITNRWGKVVYTSSSYKNETAWDGEGVVDGTYFYKLEAKGIVYTGWVEVMRGKAP